MPAYLVSRSRTTLAAADGKDQCDTQVVHAASETQAKEMASATYEGGDASWANATVTEVAAQDIADLEGWQFFVGVYDGTTTVVEVTYTAIDADSIDDVGAALVVAIEAAPGADGVIENAAYNSTTQTLTVAGTDDALGDHALIVRIAPPGKNVRRSAIPSLVGTVTDEGMASAALTVVLPGDAAAFPKLYGRLANRT